jgi:hypothetical protein
MANDDQTHESLGGETDQERRDSGLPGGGVGRRDEVGRTGVYKLSESEGASGDAPLVSEGAFGQGERGEEGYNDSGDSGLPLEEQSPEEQMGI